MRNFINLELADEEDIGDDDITALNCLHLVMNCVISDAKDRHFYTDQEYRQAVEHLEYLMQDRWGFSRRSDKHTHRKRLVREVGTFNG